MNLNCRLSSVLVSTAAIVTFQTEAVDLTWALPVAGSPLRLPSTSLRDHAQGPRSGTTQTPPSAPFDFAQGPRSGTTLKRGALLAPPLEGVWGGSLPTTFDRTLVAQYRPEYKIQDIAERITVIVLSESPTRPNEIVYRGSGVIVFWRPGTYYVLTNAHVVSTDEPYQVRVTDFNQYKGADYDVEIVGRWTREDLALLKFNSQHRYQVARLGHHAYLTRQSRVYVAGWRNLGETVRWHFTEGRMTDSDYDFVYDNETYGGMSGGPVLNQRGRLVGIHKGLRRGNRGEREGISIAIIRQRVIDRLRREGDRGFQREIPVPSCSDVQRGFCEREL